MAVDRSFLIKFLFHFSIILMVDCIQAANANFHIQEMINFENPCPGRANGLSGYYFAQVVRMLLASHCDLGNPEDYPPDSAEAVRNDDEFDFIIVGGGSSGSVIANRLTEISKWKILLLEAGGNPTFESDIPGYSVSLPGRNMDWNFAMSKGKTTCLGMENETCVIWQGKVLGGTSTINRMHYLRGNSLDYDGWAELGNAGWAYDDVLGYFKKTEKLTETFKMVNEEGSEREWKNAKESCKRNNWEFHKSSALAVGKYHSKSGIMDVDRFAYDSTLSELKKKLCESAEETGIPHVADVNGKSQIGCVQTPAILRVGNRGNAAKIFLNPIKSRKNLLVVKNAVVERLILSGKTVKGVKFSVKGKTLSVFARKEVILSAGAINSPRLLLLSGIGPEKSLKSAGVNPVHHLPGVGENLQMQISFFGLPFAMNKGKSEGVSLLQKLDAMYYFITRGEGMFGNVGLNDVVTLFDTTNGTVPDIQLLHYFNHINDYYTLNELLISLKVKNGIRDQFTQAYLKSNVLLVCPTLLRPKSTGRVELTHSNFNVPPKITYDFLKSERDVETLIRGIEKTFRIIESEPLRPFRPEFIPLNLDECKSHKVKSDEYWKCLIRHLATGTHEVAGTCKMGPKEDDMAVIDRELKVHGLKGIRVADSSIMPAIIRGSTSVASVMIGEKVSDFIKADWTKARRDEL